MNDLLLSDFFLQAAVRITAEKITPVFIPFNHDRPRQGPPSKGTLERKALADLPRGQWEKVQYKRPARQKISTPVTKLARAGAGQGKLKTRRFDLLMHDIEKLGRFLNLVDDDPIDLWLKRRELLGQGPGPETESLVLVRVE